MAIALRNKTHLNNSNSTITPTEPSGAAQDDILYYLHYFRTAGGTTFTSGPSGGWTLLNTWSGVNTAARLYRLRRGAGAPGYTVTISSGEPQEVIVSAWSGAIASDPPEGATTYNPAQLRSPSNPDCGAVTTTADNSIVIAFGQSWGGATTTWTAPSGYSTVSDGTGISNPGLGEFYISIPTSGTNENPSAFSGAGAGSFDVAEATIELLAPVVAAAATHARQVLIMGSGM